MRNYEKDRTMPAGYEIYKHEERIGKGREESIMKYLIEAFSDIGIRKKINQDSLGYIRAHDQQGVYALALICDGIGGLSKGELASAEVLRSFHSWFKSRMKELCRNKEWAKAVREEWDSLIKEQHHRLLSFGRQEQIMMGTTLTAVLFFRDRYLAVNVGDTRFYKVYPRISQITKDHSLIQREIDAGRVSEQEALSDERNGVLLQCIGANKQAVPDYFEGRVKEKEVYLLCSDGFYHVLRKEEIAQAFSLRALSSQKSMKRQAERMIEKVKQRKESDNISILLVRTYEEGR